MFSKRDSKEIELIKWLAIITMIIDHIGMIFFPDLIIIRDIGRVSYPMFAYLLIHNYIYFSTDKIKYIKRLGIFALVSSPFFYIFIDYELNIFFMFFSALGLIYIFEEIYKIDFKEKLNRRDYDLFLIAFVAFFSLLGLITFIGYKVLGFLLLITFYASFKSSSKLKIIWILLSIITLLFLNLEVHNGYQLAVSTLFSILIIFVIQKYRLGLNIRMNKYFFYIIYPGQFIVFYIFQNVFL